MTNENQGLDLNLDPLLTYQIKVEEKLDEHWSEWFDGMRFSNEIVCDGPEITVITGEVCDQAALHGILNRIRDLNLRLLSVQIISPQDWEQFQTP
jgi:hypothetical protein